MRQRACFLLPVILVSLQENLLTTPERQTNSVSRSADDELEVCDSVFLQFLGLVTKSRV